MQGGGKRTGVLVLYSFHLDPRPGQAQSPTEKFYRERDREKLKTKILNTNINDNRCISEPSGLNQHFLPIYL